MKLAEQFKNTETFDAGAPLKVDSVTVEATQLTDAAHAFGECDLYIGDDNKIYA